MITRSMMVRRTGLGPETGRTARAKTKGKSFGGRRHSTLAPVDSRSGFSRSPIIKPPMMAPATDFQAAEEQDRSALSATIRRAKETLPGGPSDAGDQRDECRAMNQTNDPDHSTAEMPTERAAWWSCRAPGMARQMRVLLRRQKQARDQQDGRRSAGEVQMLMATKAPNGSKDRAAAGNVGSSLVIIALAFRAKNGLAGNRPQKQRNRADVAITG